MPWLRTESHDSIRRLIIDRPERKNAVPSDGWHELAESFAEFERSGDRVLIVTGAGGDFCAGADLGGDRSDLGVMAQARRRMKTVERAASALFRTTKPTIAAVDGVAVGAGMNLAIGCDIVIATERARFSEIFVRRGLTIDFGGTWLLPRIVGLQRAKELALTGRMVGAREALDMGLVLDVVAHDQLEEAVEEIARSLLAGAPMAQMFIKQGLNNSFESTFHEAVSWEGQSQAIALQTEDVKEGVAAFLEKRDPDWQGR